MARLSAAPSKEVSSWDHGKLPHQLLPAGLQINRIDAQLEHLDTPSYAALGIAVLRF